MTPILAEIVVTSQEEAEALQHAMALFGLMTLAFVFMIGFMIGRLSKR